MREQFRAVTTNLTPVRVVGVPGLTLVLIAIALAMQFPEARWLIAAGICGGGAIATVLIRRRRADVDRDAGPHSNDTLMIAEPRSPAGERRRGAGQEHRETCVAIGAC